MIWTELKIDLLGPAPQQASISLTLQIHVQGVQLIDAV